MSITLEIPRDIERHLERQWGELPGERWMHWLWRHTGAAT